MNIDTLETYNNLKLAGIPEEQAQAQAKAIAHAYRVTPEDINRTNEDWRKADQKSREDFKAEMDKLIIKVDTNFIWLSRIMMTGVIGIIVNIIVELVRK